MPVSSPSVIPFSLTGIHADPRDDILFLYSPTPNPKHRSPMSLPDSYRSFDRKVPQNNPAVSVSGEQAQILPEEVDAVDLGGMAAENIVWLGWW